MSLLATVTWGRRANLVLAALTAARATDGKVVVLGAPVLARVLGQKGRDVSVARATGELPFSDDSFAALVAVSREEPAAEWLRVVRAGGALILIAIEAPAEMGRRALCAGLTDLRAGRAGRHVVMSGRVWKPTRAAPAG